MKIGVKVHPHSMRDEMVKQGNEYIVRVKAMAIDGKANEAVIEVIAKHFKVPKSNVKIITGQTGRNKIIDVRVG
ncbi:MAG: DUF167 domain-containing protein [Dehalococcoidia bacterium]|nr:DUF167 domain-containing protein [Dehalococcoidia bacterium]